MNWFNLILKKFNAKLSFLEKILCLWGIAWGSLGMVLYFFGLVSLFYRPVLIGIFFIFVVGFIYLARKLQLVEGIKKFFKNALATGKKDPLLILFLAIFLFFVVLNLIAALAPELGYDALWYHLTLPKIYLLTHQIRYIAGGVLYYSVMPRLAEMFFGVGLSFDPSGTFSRLIHLSFGLAWFTGIFMFLRLFLSRRYSLILAVMIYGTILVSWLSQTAYVDLIVAFYCLLSCWGFFRYLKSKDQFFLDLSAIFMGLNLASKLYGLIIYAVLLLFILIKAGWKKALRFAAIAFLFGLPFYLQAFLATGNPIYPVFSIRDSALETYLAGYQTVKEWLLHAWWVLLPRLLWRTLVYDFTPLFGLVLILPLVKNWQKMLLPLGIFFVFFILWSMVPVQEPRYFLVILPLLALLIGFFMENFAFKFFRMLAICFMLAVLILNGAKIFRDYQKTFPVVFGKVSRLEYLQENLPQTLNFYDADGYFKNHLGAQDKVLTAEIGNLFYVDFPFWDWSFIPARVEWLQSAQILQKNLKDNGFTYVLLDKKNLANWTNLPDNELGSFFEEVYANDYLKLYRVK